MNPLHKAAQQALEALEWISHCYVGDDDDAGECASCHQRSYKPHAPDCKKNNAITALRAALAQQAEPVEPVAWVLDGTSVVEFYREPYHNGPEWTPLCKCADTPPQRKPLTEEVAALIAQRDALLEALRALVRNEGLDAYSYLDKGIGTATAAGKRWLNARAAIKTVEGEKT